MVVYAISDLHGELPAIPQDALALLIGGDICPDFRPTSPRDQGRYVATDGQRQARWLDTDFREWLETRPNACPVYAIWGNHDFVGEKPFLVPDLPWNLINDKYAVCRDPNGQQVFTIYGSPWVPGLQRWAFYGSDRVLAARAESIPTTLDILLSHGPPYGAGDFIPGGTPKQVEKYSNLSGMRVGDPALTEITRDARTAPKNIVCGHIHEDRGVHISGATTVYNVAAVDALYDLLPNPWTVIHL